VRGWGEGTCLIGETTYIYHMTVLALLLAVVTIFFVGTGLLLGAHWFSMQVAKFLESLLDKAAEVATPVMPANAVASLGVTHVAPQRLMRQRPSYARIAGAVNTGLIRRIKKPAPPGAGPRSYSLGFPSYARTAGLKLYVASASSAGIAMPKAMPAAAITTLSAV
jgi:hypothetical protein